MSTTTLKTSRYQVRDFSKLRKGITFFLKTIRSRISQTVNSSSNTSSSNKKNIKKIIPLAFLIIIIGIVILASARTLSASSQKAAKDEKPTVQGPLATNDINREFSFPLTDSKGKELTKIKYTIENAELRNEIIVKGTRATAIEGRVFLILNIKITNDYDKAVQINARDYLRLSVNGNTQELLAADIHNDPVTIQAISVKTTRLGFPINESDKDLLLKVGEIKEQKEDITISFN